jgi:Ran GTPase-activating protein (RanGAP) involved in mRNA processing and transport
VPITALLLLNSRSVSQEKSVVAVQVEGARALSCALAKNSALEVLRLERSQVGDTGAVALAGGLRASRSLRQLELPFNKIGPDGAAALAAALMPEAGPESGVCPLKRLNLSHNVLRDLGVTLMEPHLSQAPYLEDLILQDCDIGASGERLSGSI